MTQVRITTGRKTVPEALAELGRIYQARRVTYGDTDKRYGLVMTALFPEGLSMVRADDWGRLALLSHCVDKLMRYSSSFEHGGHGDSLDDLSVYAQMLRELDVEVRDGNDRGSVGRHGQCDGRGAEGVTPEQRVSEAVDGLVGGRGPTGLGGPRHSSA